MGTCSPTRVCCHALGRSLVRADTPRDDTRRPSYYLGLHLIWVGVPSHVAGTSWMPQARLGPLSLHTTTCGFASRRPERAIHLVLDIATLLRNFGSGTLHASHRIRGLAGLS